MDLRLMLAMGLAMFGGGLWRIAHLTVYSAFWRLFWPQACMAAPLCSSYCQSIRSNWVACPRQH
jgi:hypothetical protein